MAPRRARAFAYVGVDIDPAARTLTCRYRQDGDRVDEFVEVATFDESVDLSAPGVETTAVLYLLLAGLSYYKTGAAPLVDLGDVGVGPATSALLTAAIREGLGEFALRNGLSVDDVTLQGGRDLGTPVRRDAPRGPLVPFGGGIDSIVTASAVDRRDAALFVLGPRTERFEAIERPAALTGLPVTRCARALDPAVRRSDPRWFDGHVPVTAMVSALAAVAAVAQGRDAVVMSNERSASSPTVVIDGRAVNHQWSKSWACENLLRAALDERLDPAPSYESALRDRSELWVARAFAAMPEYLGAFMSCNRAFRQDVATRATTWCGACDKCLFTDLVLAPFVDRPALEAVFGGVEPLADPARHPALEVLVGVLDNPRPFECVGDAVECASALVAASRRADRADQPHLAALAARCAPARPLDELLVPEGPTNSSVLDASRDLV